jgi:hypothetical protein
MLLRREEFEHPTQVSRVRLNLFEQPGSADGPVTGMLPAEKGYLLTEDRIGSNTVVATLGFFTDREEAVARFERRGQELLAQSYRHRPAPDARVER